MQAMTDVELRHRALASPIRVRLLALLRRSGGALAVEELAGAVGLHPNTVREHLDRLVVAGLAVRDIAPPAGRGRPRLRYTAAGPGDADVAAYTGLARALSDALEDLPDPASAAVAAGERWGRAMIAGDGAAPAAAPAERVLAMLDRSGFAPDSDGHGDPIRLRACPFLSLARDRQRVVCSVHLGLLRGAVTELGLAPDGIRLEPLVAPNLCLAHVPAVDHG